MAVTAAPAPAPAAPAAPAGPAPAAAGHPRESSSSADAAVQAPWTTQSTVATGAACQAVSSSRDGMFMDMAPIEIDHAALAAFECPSFNEAEAVDLDGCVPCAWDVAPYVDHLKTTTTEKTGQVHHETSFQALLQSSDFVFLAPVQLDRQDSDGTADYFNYHQDQEENDEEDFEEEDEEVLDLSDPRNRCSYRKGKCGQQRTRKADGHLHTYCAFHRFRSIANQRQFDAKRRKSLASTKPRKSSTSSSSSKESKTRRHQEKPEAGTDAQGECVGAQMVQKAIVGQLDSRPAKRVTRFSVRAASLSIVL